MVRATFSPQSLSFTSPPLLPFRSFRSSLFKHIDLLPTFQFSLIHHSVTTVALNRYIIIDTTLIGQQTERISILEYAIPTSAAPSPQNVMVLARVRGDFRKVGYLYGRFSS